MTEDSWDQRPRFERLVRRVAVEGLEPYGFARASSRVWTRQPSPDLAHRIHWQKANWTQDVAVRFYVNLSSTWLTGPDTSWPGHQPQRPEVIDCRLRIPLTEAMAEPSGRATWTDLFVLTDQVTDDAAAAVLLRLFAEQGLPALDTVATPADCIDALREPDASVPGAETLMRHFAATGDRARVQQQYERLRRHFGHRDFPRDPALRALVAELRLTEPPPSAEENPPTP